MAEGKLRSIRIAGELLDRAEAEAAVRGLSFNAWLSMLMADALNGDIYVLVPRKRESIPERFGQAPPTAAARPELAQPAAARVAEAKAAVAAADRRDWRPDPVPGAGLKRPRPRPSR